MNSKLFQELKEKYDSHTRERREIRIKADEVTSESKLSTIALLYDRVEEAKEHLQKAESILNELESNFKKNPKLREEGSYRAALEEYVEAKLFWQVIKENQLTFIEEKIPISYQAYIGGICDLTGEILRKATIDGGEGRYDKVRKYGKIMREIELQLAKISLVGFLRGKRDALERNCRKMGTILYDIREVKKE